MVALDKFLANPDNTRDVVGREIDFMEEQLEAMKKYYVALNYRSYYHANNQTWPDQI